MRMRTRCHNYSALLRLSEPDQRPAPVAVAMAEAEDAAAQSASASEDAGAMQCDHRNDPATSRPGQGTALQGEGRVS